MPATTTPQLKEGRYNIEQEFTSGTDRSVFQAYDIKCEEPVTIAEIPVRLPKVATISQRDALTVAFEEQAKALSVFKHKSALSIRDHFVEAGRHYVVTDPMDGVDLATVQADQDGPFSVAAVTSWADTLLDVFNSLHICRPPFVYKHLKPECIIQRAGENVVVALWGMLDLSSGLSGGADSVGGEQPSIVYSPLEQIWSGLDAASQKVIVSKYDEASERTLKQPLDARSDIYSLGAVLYHLITGRLPVDALERSIEMIEGGPDPLKAPNKLDSSIPTEISDVIMKAMDIRREYRFDSAAIMRQVMRTAVVRVKEREEEERREEEEVLRELRSAQAGLMSSAAPNKLEVRSETLRTEPKVENRHMAEAPKPQPVSVAEPSPSADPDDDLLGLLSDTSTPPNLIHVSSPAETHKPTEPADEPRLASSSPSRPVSVETVANDARVSDHAESIGAASETNTDTVRETVAPTAEAKSDTDEQKETPSLVSPDPSTADRDAEPRKVVAYSAAEPDLFHKEKSSSRGVMAVAAGVVVVCLAAVGGWFIFGSAPKASTSSTVAPAPAAMTQPQTEQPAVAEPQPVQSPELTAAPANQPEGESIVEGETPTDQPTQKVAASSPQRPRKQAPAPKTAAPKKPVTVDDLINDN